VAGYDPACVPWNIWNKGGVDAAQLAYLTVQSTYDVTATEYVVDGSVTGDLGKYGWKIPSAATPIQVNVGTEYRQESYDFAPDYIFSHEHDWDSHTMFCGVKDAVLQVEGQGAMDSTAPNGRFDLCLPAGAATSRLTVTFAAVNSECTSPKSNYTLPTIIVGNPAVIHAGGFTSARAMTVARQASFFTQIGQTFDPTRGQLFVHVNGVNPKKLTLAGDHGAPQVTTTTGWAAGDTGTEVFFPNVAVGSGTAKLTIEGTGIGAGDLPIVAGTLTDVAVISN